MRVLLGCLAVAALASSAAAQETPVERGDYLVNRVTNCGDCHTPRGEHGRPIAGKELTGAPFNSRPLHPIPGYGVYAPALRGLPAGYSKADLAKLLQTGVRPDGTHTTPPMPPFRLDEQDAQAVAAYLASLKP
ncbi:MAG: cytochrome c [Caulobacteraceae bacterium]